MGRPRQARAREGVARAFWALLDAGWWYGAILVTLWLRFSYDASIAFNLEAYATAGAVAGFHVLVGLVFGPYLVSHIRGSFEEVVSLARATLITGLVFFAYALLDNPVPRSVPLLAAAVALITMLASRFVVRSFRAHRLAQRSSDHAVIIFGAGLAGRRLVRNLIADDSSYRPVALVDDDRGKRKLRIEGVPVKGDRTAIAKLAHRYDATHLVVAIPTADAELMRDARQIAEAAGLELKVLPTIDNILGRNPHASDLRDINLEDLLGRRPISLDQGAIADQITGKTILVTGAGGSIGSELCRQIARFHPARLILLERDESAMHATQLSMTGRGLLEGEDLFLADIRDLPTLRRLFAQAKPDMVFHAAALKHLTLLEKHPSEAWQTNVIGTLNVLSAAAEAGVGTFVNISTDKAADPTSVLGYSKRVAERLTAHYAATQPGRYVSVRFGNVLGSRGSVIPAFTEQIRRGGPVTVTHPDVERYFMLIPEACQLVLQASAMGRDGQVMVLDMGTPIRIADVAQTLIHMSGNTNITITYTGLRPGEKLSENLFTNGETQQATEHPLVRAVNVPELVPAAVDIDHDRHHLRNYLASLIQSEDRGQPETVDSDRVDLIDR